MSDQSKTLFTTVTEYLDSLHQSKTKESSVKIYERCLGVALEYFGNEKKLTSILVLHTGKFYASDLVNKNPKTGAPRAEATVKQIKRVFRQCLEFALAQGFVDTLQVPKSEMEHARSRKRSTKTETPQLEVSETDQAASQS
ncbi:MAG: hypothetical protein ACE5GM_10560 [bacterium]